MLSWMTTAVLAIALCSFLPVLPPLWTIAGVFALSVAGHWRLRQAWTALLLAFALGMAYGSAYGYWRLSKALPEALEAKSLTAQIRVISHPELRSGKSDYYRFDATASLESCGEMSCPAELGKLRLNWYEPVPPQLGAYYRVVLKLKRPRGYASPGAFDYGQWLFLNAYAGTGYVRALKGGASVSSGIQAPLWRQRLLSRYQSRLDSYPESGLMRALLFGDRGGLSPDRWKTLTNTGTAHLMAISGMHIGIVAGWAFLIARGLAGWLPSSIWSLSVPAFASLAGALVYSAMAGFSLPTVRALIMLSLFLIGTILPRKLSPWRVLLVAMLAVFIVDPLAALRPGFYLSFGAVALLFWVFGQARGTGQSRIMSLLQVQWVLGVGLLPIIAMSGFPFAVAGFFANLVAIPLVALWVLPLLLLGFLTSTLPLGVTEWCWQLADFSLQLLMTVLIKSSTLAPVMSLNLGYWQAGIVLLLLAVLLQPALPLRVLASVCAILIFFSSSQPIAKGNMEIWALDVGQGLSVLVRTENHQLLFDVGPDFDSGLNSADAVVIPLLKRLNIDKLDALVLSHNDRDHAGSARYLLEAIKVAKVYRGQAAAKDLAASAGQSVLDCHSAPSWNWDGISFRFLHRSIADGASSNDHSCVLEVRSGASGVLVPGDISVKAEAGLLADTQLASVSLLIAPHHGSHSSSSVDFIDALQPQQVVFSAAYKHAYGHPAPVVVGRYRDIGSRCWQTALHGSTRWRYNPDGLQEIKHFRGAFHYWDLAVPGSECHK